MMTYIPNYTDIFANNNMKEQCYIATLMMKNLTRKKLIGDF